MTQIKVDVKKLPEDSKFLSLTGKQRGFVMDLVSGETAKDAFQNNYDVENSKEITIKNNANKLKNHPKVKMAIREVYEAVGIDTGLIAQVHFDAMHATKQFWDAKEGNIVETALPDHGIRLKAAKQAADILKDEVQGDDIKKQVLNVNIVASEEMEKDFSAFLKDKYRKKA